MLKRLSYQFGSFALLCLWTLTMLLGYSGSAAASKVVESMGFDPTASTINVVSTYATTPATQKTVLKSALKASKTLYKKAPGFQGLSILQSVDGAQVVTLTQWQDQASYEAATAAAATAAAAKLTEKSTKKAAPGAELPTPVTTVFELDQAAAPTGMLVALRGENAVVQWETLTPATPEAQAKVVAAAEAVFPTLQTLYPAPRSTVLLKGVDTPAVGLLTSWGYADEFADVTQIPTLNPATEAGTEVEAEHHLLTVVKVVAPKVKAAEEED